MQSKGCHVCDFNRIVGLMANVLVSSVVDRETWSQSGQTKDYTIGICDFFAKHTTLSSENN